MHAANGYYLLNFEISGSTPITVTADDPHYWDAGVEIQPMRLGIRPRRDGASITFTLDGPAKLSITRPGTFFSDSEMLFLFANQPDLSGVTEKTPGVRYYGPGLHRGNIDARTGDHIYLAAGAVVLGALNIWKVHDVRVYGLGTIVYDGPQDPNTDQGWMHKPNWHVIVMDDARNIQIEGITGIVRSRTWMVQMRDSHNIVFRNVKIVGGDAGNANQDGMDWLGGGDTLVQDSFIRASDDIFAMYGNWDGYGDNELTTPGHDVGNIVVENSVLSTSISNVVRLGWPRKIFNSHDFTLRNSDIIQMGVGGCGVPFALFEIWADPGGVGHHTNIQFQNIRMDDWYSLVQLRQPNPGIRDVTFTNVWAMDGPGMVPSMLKGDIAGVGFSGVNLGSGDVLKSSDVPIEIEDGAEEPTYKTGTVDASFVYSSGLIRPGSEVVFRAKTKLGLHYRWLFGDGDTAEGPIVRHVFPDTQGTLLDGTGRFRVLLSVNESTGHGPDNESGVRAWSSQSIVVSSSLQPSASVPTVLPGLTSIEGGANRNEGLLNVPASGGYTVFLLTSTSASLSIDGTRVNSAKLHPQVCGSPGNAVQAVRVSVALARGQHSILIERGLELENAAFPNSVPGQPVLFWEGPGIALEPVPASALSHAAIHR
jgi:hypothetical protein